MVALVQLYHAKKSVLNSFLCKFWDLISSEDYVMLSSLLEILASKMARNYLCIGEMNCSDVSYSHCINNLLKVLGVNSDLSMFFISNLFCIYCNHFQVHISQIADITCSQLTIESLLSEIGYSFESVSCYECDDFLEAPSDTTPVILSDKLFISTTGESITDSLLVIFRISVISYLLFTC